MSVLMNLGDFKFTILDLNYQKLVTEYEARWKENFTAGGGHVDMFLGGNPLAITISGILFPAHYGGLEPAHALGAEANTGKPMPLYSRAGRNFGKVKVLGISITDETIGPDGVVIEAGYELRVSQYSGGNDRNPLMNRTALPGTLF